MAAHDTNSRNNSHVEEIQHGQSGPLPINGSNKPGLPEIQNSTEAQMPNVLEGIAYDELMRDVERFAVEHQLEDILPLLQKGALVAQNPHEIEQLSELDNADRQVLREEITHKWKQPHALYFTIILNSIASAVQGWDVTGSNGANLTFPQAFGIPDSGAECTAAGTCLRNSWLIGVINAFPFLTIAFLSVILHR